MPCRTRLPDVTPAWDELTEAVDHALVGEPRDPEALATQLLPVLQAAMDDGTADRELDPHRTARLLAALLVGTRAVHPDDADIATARMVVTRWLHPPRVAARHTVGDPI